MTAAPETLLGNVERIDRTGVAGWAMDVQDPGTPVLLEITHGGTVLGQVTADQFRTDLDRPGMAGGRHGFWFVFDPPLAPEQRHLIAVRRAGDGTDLPGSPLLLDRQISLDAAAIQTLTDMAADPAFAAELRAYAASRRDILARHRADLLRLREIT